MEEAAGPTPGHAPWLGACLPKTPNRQSADKKTANTVPCSFPGIAHIYIKEGGVGGGGRVGVEAIPFCVLYKVTTTFYPSKFRAQEACPRGEKLLTGFAYSRL